MKSKIALACDWFLPRIGGIELHMADLAERLRDRGHEVCVITTTPGPPEYLGIPVHRVKVLMIPGLPNAAPNLWKVRMLRRLLRDEKVNVVHAHGMFSTLAIGCILAAYYERIPSITTHHSLIRGIVRPLARLVFAVFSHRVDLVTAVSEAAAADARLASGRSDVEILPNGIDPSVWKTASPPDDDINVISVMRLARKKTPRDLVRAVPEILARTPEQPRIRFTIVGDGPERPHMERMVNELGLQDKIDLVGSQDRDAISKLMTRSSLMLSPCGEEAFGITLLEARCAQLPVVAMNHGGTADIIEHGRNGFLANSHQEFVDLAVRVLSDPQLRQDLRSGGNRDVDRFSWDAVVDRHLEVYRRAEEQSARG